MTVKEAMTNIANKIRDISGLSRKIRLAEIPSLIVNICEDHYSGGWSSGYSSGWDEGYYYGEENGIDIGYANGYTEGYDEGESNGFANGKVDGLELGYEQGVQAEYDRFWDSFQANGNRRNYPYGFSGSCWNDDTYNPKYEIIVTNSCAEMFRYNSQITSTKVPITIDTDVTAPSVFLGCTRLREIPSIKVTEKVPEFAYWFQGCNALTTINFTDDSVIGNSINFQWSPLTPESAWNVVQHLKYYHPEDTAHMSYTITFSTAVWEALDEYTRENELHGWGFVKDYIENDIGWRTA